MSIVQKNQKSYYELLEWVDYLAQIDGRVMIQVGSPEVEGLKPEMMSVWFDRLEEKGLVDILERPVLPIIRGPLGSTKNDWFVLYIKDRDKFHDYVNEVYRNARLNVQSLSSQAFLAVLDITYDIWQKAEVTREKTVFIKAKPARLRFPELADYDDDYRHTALNFLKEYGAIQDFERNDDLYAVTFERRYFDRSYQTIMTRAVQEGFASYKGDPVQTKAIAEESKRRSKSAKLQEEKPPITPKSEAVSNAKITFDVKSSSLRQRKKECPIPDETLEHYVCKFVFKNRRVAAMEVDILDAAGIGQNSKRPVYDAHLRINKRVKDNFGIPKLLIYRAAKVRIDKRYQ